MSGTAAIDKESLFAVYDLAIRRWIVNVVDQVVKNVPVIQASPQRAFSEALDVQRRNLKPGSSLPTGANESLLIPLPLISFQRVGDIANRDVRMPPIGNLLVSHHTDESARAVWSAKPPHALSISYQIDIWSKTINVQSQLITAVQHAFDPEFAYTSAHVSDFWGDVWMPIKKASLDDTSELEGTDAGDRIIRHSLRVDVEAWSFPKPVKHLTAKTVQVDEEVLGDGMINMGSLRYNHLYFQDEKGSWSKMLIKNGGRIHWVSMPNPPTDVELVFDDKRTLVFENLWLNDADTAHSYRLSYREGPNRYVTQLWPTAETTRVKSLAVSRVQSTALQGSTSVFGEMQMRNSRPVYHTRPIPKSTLSALENVGF